MKNIIFIYFLFNYIFSFGNCLDGNIIQFQFQNTREINSKGFTLEVKETESIIGIEYRKVYLINNEKEPSKLVGYIRADSSCSVWYFLNLNNRSETKIYDKNIKRFKLFKIYHKDSKNLEQIFYYQVHKIEEFNKRKVIELKPPIKNWNRKFSLKFIEDIGPNSCYFLNELKFSALNNGIPNILVRKSIDGRIVYENNKFKIDSITTNKELLITIEDGDYYRDLGYENYLTIEKKIKSAKDIYLTIKYMNWDGGIEMVNKLIDHPKCDKGTALLAFWYNCPDYYIDKEENKLSFWEKNGYKLHHKLFKRLTTNYYSNEVISFDPGNFYYNFFKEQIYLPEELRVPTKGILIKTK